jgi:hypothetical protein
MYIWNGSQRSLIAQVGHDSHQLTAISAFNDLLKATFPSPSDLQGTSCPQAPE